MANNERANADIDTESDLSRDRHGNTWLQRARQQADHTVALVRNRESPSRLADSTNLDLEFVRSCHFVSKHEMEMTSFPKKMWSDPTNGNQQSGEGCGEHTVERKLVTSKKILIATGASPVLPGHLVEAAQRCNLPFFTYRSFLRPPGSQEITNDSIWNLLNNVTHPSLLGQKRSVVIAGGGATACEIGQALARLGGDALDVTIVAPSILPSEDVSLRHAAARMLTNEGVTLRLGRRVANILPCIDPTCNDGSDRNISPTTNALVQLDDNSTLPTDSIVLCLGREPGSSLQELSLENANVDWSPKGGVEVNNYLRSKTAKNVYACGDCASAIQARDQRAAHAGWTGFHSVRNALLPGFLRSPAVHPVVPRVAYTHPEMASVGLSRTECVRRFGRQGFQFLNIPEVGTDRADMEDKERDTSIGFVELRVKRHTGKILGATVCGPAASELVNEVGLAITNGLTVRDMARAIHSYPSHGYLLYRVALALATSSISGLLASCGPFGRVLGWLVRKINRVSSIRPARYLPWKRRLFNNVKKWEAQGSDSSLVLDSSFNIDTSVTSSVKGDSKNDLLQGKDINIVSYLDVYNNSTLTEEILRFQSKAATDKVTNEHETNISPKVGQKVSLEYNHFIHWLRSKPKP